MNKLLYTTLRVGVLSALLVGCVTPVYKPGAIGNPLNNLKLGQTYSEMTKVLGEPDQSRAENRTAEETAILFVPVWNIVESIGDYNPSSIQIYTYTQWGTVTIDNNNHIIRIEAK